MKGDFRFNRNWTMKLEYDCFGAGRVSVWIGRFGKKEQFTDYMEVTYTEYGESVSGFLNDYPISDFDEDFSEKFFFENEGILERTLPLFSYIETFKDDLEKDLLNIDVNNRDSILFVFDCDASFMKDFTNPRMQLSGVYNYTK